MKRNYDWEWARAIVRKLIKNKAGNKKISHEVGMMCLILGDGIYKLMKADKVIGPWCKRYGGDEWHTVITRG